MERSDELRWKQEAEFFDREAEAEMRRIRPVDPFVLDRYGRLRRRRFNKEYRFRALGDLAGKSVLDVGCGDGTNAVNFAKLGAKVTGIDISPGSIALARERMRVNGVSDSVQFVCSPLELANFPDNSFDIIWADAIFHHLIPDLDAVLDHLLRWAKPGAMVMIAEPINLSPTLRRLRRAIPVVTDATPDERPLESAELEIVKQHLPRATIRYFSLFDRLNRFVLTDRFNYERSSRPRRMVANLISLLDYAILSLPPFQPLAGTCVIHGRTSDVRRPAGVV